MNRIKGRTVISTLSAIKAYFSFQPSTHGEDGLPNIRGYMPELDGLRAFAILFVLLVHWIDIPNQSDFLGIALLGLTRFGWIGVDLFFVLSGFLITGILLRSLGSPHFFRDFYMRRSLRILPLYYAVITFIMIIIPAVGLGGHYEGAWKIYGNSIYYYLFLSNFSSPIGYSRHGLLFITWSLCVEEHFYLIWPLILYRYHKHAARICLGVILCSTGGRILFLHLIDGNSQLINFSTPFRLDGLAMGSLMAYYAYRGNEGIATLWRWSRWALPIGFVGVVITLVFQEMNAYHEWHLLGEHPLVVSFGKFFVDLFFAALVFVIVFGKPNSWISTLCRWNPLIRIGKLTFSIYLVHLIVRWGFFEILSAFGVPIVRTFSFMVHTTLISFFLTLLVALLSWKFFESPILGLKRHFAYKQGKANNLKDPPVLKAG